MLAQKRIKIMCTHIFSNFFEFPAHFQSLFGFLEKKLFTSTLPETQIVYTRFSTLQVKRPTPSPTTPGNGLCYRCVMSAFNHSYSWNIPNEMSQQRNDQHIHVCCCEPRQRLSSVFWKVSTIHFCCVHA